MVLLWLLACGVSGSDTATVHELVAAFPPIMTTSVSHLDLGATELGEPLEATFEVRNEGELDLGVQCWSLSSAGSSQRGDEGAFSVELDLSGAEVHVAGAATDGTCASGLLFTLPPDGVVPVTVTFAADAAGASYDAFDIVSADEVTTGVARASAAFADRAHLHEQVTFEAWGVDGSDDGEEVEDSGEPASHPPRLIGEVDASQVGLEPFETAELSLMVVDEDGGELDIEWSYTTDREDAGTLVRGAGTTATFTAASVGNEGARVKLFVEVSDERGNAVWDFENLQIYPMGTIHGPWILAREVDVR